ncbi:MAG TPA: hypothetical protein VGP25_04835 [Gemmatimonadaceae bacterium]|nr:hypothetical protein [Gemmatimonadaceae bacterium]
MRIARLLCVLSALSIALEHAQAQEVTVSGRVPALASALVRNHYVQVYAVDSRPDNPLRSVQLSSKDFDAWLIVVSPDGTAYFDDQSGGDNNARLRIPARTGEWLIVVTAYDPRSPGAFTLTVDGPPPVPTSRRLPGAAIEHLPGGKGVAAALARPRVDTVTVTKVDTVTVMRVDTVRTTRVDTVTRTKPGGPVRSTTPR